ncbi:MAG: SPASM domain-containing protein [Planctomycetes bacterium]|nr:SPASM domain-containing protein [Planctomycetota bacterium]
MPRLLDQRFLRLKLDMVNKCQLRCIMCHFAHPDFVESGVQMDRPLLEKVAKETFPISHDVVLSSSAEPLMATELPRALELCREYEVPSFHFSTNAMSMTRSIMEKVIEVQMPLLTISMDGATKETFEDVRRPAKWDKFVGKFDLIAEEKAKSSSVFPKLSVTVVLMRRNIREVPDLIRFVAERGVQYVNFAHMGVMGGLGVEDETLSKDPALSNAKIAEAHAVAKEVGVTLMAPLPFPPDFVARAAGEDVASSDEGGGKALVKEGHGSFSVDEFLNHKNLEFNLKVTPRKGHRRPCYFPWRYLHVNPDGTVFPCGHWFEFTTFGDFKTQNFREIWTGPQFRELRRQLRTLELRKTCANCSVSGMGRPDVLASFSRREKLRV